MTRLKKALLSSAAVTLLFAGQASAQNILWWEDYTLGTSVVPGALALYSYTATQATGSADFYNKLTSNPWDLVIFGEQNTLEFDGAVQTALMNYVTGGGKVLGATWEGSPFAQYMGATIGGTNPGYLTGDTHPIFDGLGTINLANPGWGIYARAYGTGAGTCLGTTQYGGCAAVLGNGGNTLLLSPLFDAYADLGVGQQFVGQSADFLLNGGSTQVTPEPVSMTLIATGLAGIASARRKRRSAQTPVA
jgi:hypothetical protein